MDRFAEKQAWIEACRQELFLQYPALLEKIISAWQQPGSDPRAWLLYSANYLFHTGGVRWALDPFLLPSRLGVVDYEALPDFSPLSFALLTHEHRDHLDLGFINFLSALPMRWVIPQALQARVLGSSRLDANKVITPRPMKWLELEGIRILPFEAQHFALENGRLRGVPAMGYLVEQDGRHWLFPGDTRDYDLRLQPRLEAVDAAFVHLWLGRREALEQNPSQLAAFCRFCAGLPARRIFLTHLEELGRQADDYWDMDHAGRVMELLKWVCPEKSVQAFRMGDEIEL